MQSGIANNKPTIALFGFIDFGAHSDALLQFCLANISQVLLNSYDVFTEISLQ